MQHREWYFSWNEEVIYVNNKEHFDWCKYGLNVKTSFSPCQETPLYKLIIIFSAAISSVRVGTYFLFWSFTDVFRFVFIGTDKESDFEISAFKALCSFTTVLTLPGKGNCLKDKSKVKKKVLGCTLIKLKY